jgi:hypothetical protein
MRVVSVETDKDLPAALAEALREWPHFQVIDVYNDHDEAILRLAADDALGASRH